MESWILLAGLGLGLVGALLIALADAWLSRALLVYLDAVEANITEVVRMLREGGTQLDITAIDLKRDRGQNRARALKSLGWLTLVLGFALQLAAAWLARPSA
jgi:hypothetical protein